MNKLISNFNYGFSLKSNDIRWLTDSFTDSIQAFFSAFGATAPNSYRLSGCDISIDHATHATTAGYIVLNGEVLKVDAHSVDVTPGHTAKWDVEETNDNIGNKLDKFGNPHQCYLVRKGKLVDTVVATPPTYMPYNAEFIHEKIKNLVNATEEAWHYVGTLGNPAFAPGWENTAGNVENLRFKKTVDGRVQIEGHIKNDNFSSLIFTLPEGYRPTKYREIQTYLLSSTDVYYPVLVEITDTGNVQLFLLNGGPNGTVVVGLDNIRFSLD